jgi:small subunit ribosomal protein S1
MGWSRVANPAELVRPGDEVTVKVLRVDDDSQKIALGLKQLSADPWSTVEATYAVGQVHGGRVTRIADFGAFVELQPGVEALAHLSTFPPTAEGWKASIQAGTTGSFEILSVDLDKKRIGVALVSGGASPSPRPAGQGIIPGARLTGKVERHEKFGVFVFLAPGRTGLIPMKETGVVREADIARTFPVGSEVEVDVLEVDTASRRIRLSPQVRPRRQGARRSARVHGEERRRARRRASGRWPTSCAGPCGRRTGRAEGTATVFRNAKKQFSFSCKAPRIPLCCEKAKLLLRVSENGCCPLSPTLRSL